MRVPPSDVSDADVAECVATGWGVRVDEISYAPVGFGSHHWHLTTDVGRLFATVDMTRSQVELAAALNTAAILYDRGLEFVHPPLEAVDGAVLHCVAGRYAVAVHRWIDGTVASDLRENPTSVTIELLARLHGQSLSQLPARRIDMTVDSRTGFETAMRRVDIPWPGPYGEASRRLLHKHRARLADLFATHDRQGTELLAYQDDWVITHGEPHISNLVASGDGLYLIDWNTAFVAPAARDVWQVGDVDEMRHYIELTGRTPSQLALSYFRRDWDLVEVCQNVTVFAAPHHESEDTRVRWTDFSESMDRLLSTGNSASVQDAPAPIDDRLPRLRRFG